MTEITTTQRETLAAFADAVRASPHNLLSARALEELASRHVEESVAFAKSLPDQSHVLDLGTGGGFPGMVVAIVRPDCDVTLLDATLKKITFLQETAEELQIGVRTLRGRAEDLQTQHAAAFDVVTARAVAPLQQLVPWAVPFLRVGGTLHAIKGKSWRDELRDALPVIEQLRCSVVGVPGRPPPSTVARDVDRPSMPRVVIIQRGA
jgi:16S rRNA (guanine527-N7)-methyltransferase